MKYFHRVLTVRLMISPNNFWNLLLDFATDSTTYCYHHIRPKLFTIISKIITQETILRHPSISNWLIRSSQIFILTPMIGSCGGIPSSKFSTVAPDISSRLIRRKLARTHVTIRLPIGQCGRGNYLPSNA